MNSNDVSKDTGEIAEPISFNISTGKDQAQAPTPAVIRDNSFYFETVTFQVHFNLFFPSLFITQLFTGRSRIRSSVFSKVDLK
jgi:hypothetical protein